MECEIFRILLKNLSDHLSVLFQFAWLYLSTLNFRFGQKNVLWHIYRLAFTNLSFNLNMCGLRDFLYIYIYIYIYKTKNKKKKYSEFHVIHATILIIALYQKGAIQMISLFIDVISCFTWRVRFTTLSLFWWRHWQITSDLLFSKFLPGSTIIANFSLKQMLNFFKMGL